MHMLIQTVIVILLLSLPRITLGQSTARTSVSLIYEAIAATNATLWLAEDARLFQKYGLDAKVVSLSIKARVAILLAALRAQACYWFSTQTGEFVTSPYYRDQPHGWVKQFNGPRPADACRYAVQSICRSVRSSRGAMRVMPGIGRRYAMSYRP